MKSCQVISRHQVYLAAFGILLFLIIGQARGEIIESLAVKVDYDHSAPVNIKKYGTNGALLASKIGYGDQQLVNIYKQTSVVFTRFPGGSIGNYYNWKNGNFSCYRKPDDQSQMRIDRMNRALATRGVTYKTDDFFNFIKNIGGDFTYMLNIMCDTPVNNALLLRQMKNKNIALKYIEMANEIYSSSYAWAYKDVSSYMDSVAANYMAIKREHPNAKVGLVVSPLSFSSKNKPKKPGIPNPSWPKQLRQFDIASANSSMSDALIIHLYTHPYLDESLFFQKKTYQEHYLSSIDQFNRNFKISVDYLKSLGNNKPIWITEWGVTAPVDKRKGIFRKYKKNAYQALYIASALVSMATEKSIELANYHNASDLWVLTNGGPVVTPIGEIFSLFIQSAKNSDIAYNVQLSLGASGKSAVGIKSVLFSSSEKQFLLIINEQDKGYRLDKLDTGENKYKNYSFSSMYIENDVFEQPDAIVEKLNHITEIVIDIKPYSVSVISLH